MTQAGFWARKPLAPSHSESYFVGTKIHVPILQLLITLLQEDQLFPPYTLPEPYLSTAYPVSQVLIAYTITKPTTKKAITQIGIRIFLYNPDI